MRLFDRFLDYLALFHAVNREVTPAEAEQVTGIRPNDFATAKQREVYLFTLRLIDFCHDHPPRKPPEWL